MRKTSTVLLALALLLAACGTGTSSSPAPSATAAASSGPPTTTPSSVATTEPTTSPTDNPTGTPVLSPVPSPTVGGSDVAIVRIEAIGGFMAPWVTLGWYPSVVLYEDGRLITVGAQDAIYPAPALPNLRVTQLTHDGMEQVLAWAAEAGLHGPDRQLGPILMDAGETVFTVVSADGTHKTHVTDLEADDPETATVRHFQEVLLGIREWLPDDVVGEDQPYPFDRLRLISSETDPASVDPQLSETIDWPLETSIADMSDPISEPPTNRCALIQGEDLQTLMPLFQGANQLTLWRSDDTFYQFVLRPLLPDEEACPTV